MVSRFRVMRLYCHIQLSEVAAAAGISPQRLYQLEIKYKGIKPINSEQIIKALESVIDRRKTELEKVEQICALERGTIFDRVESGEDL